MGILLILGLVVLLLGILTVIFIKDRDSELGGVLVGIGIGVSVFCGVVSLIQSGVVHSHQTTLIQYGRDKAIAQKQYDAQTKIILALVKDYPIEEELIKSFNPSMLLMLPEIKSNTLIIEQIKLTVEYRDILFSIEYKCNRIKQKLDWYSNKLFSLSFISTKYKAN